jgi:malonyl-CoA O-methyltransferase
MTLTPLDHPAARRSFDRAAGSYDQHAVLQSEVAERLLERLDYFQLGPQRLLDVGCGTGRVSLALAQRFPTASVMAMDWSPAMLRQARTRQAAAPEGQLQALCANMQALPLAAASVDLVFSNLAMQWSNDLPGLFAGIRRVLRPGGMLVFSTFGPDTLHELRSAWAQADKRPHVNRFMDMHDIGDCMVAAGFRDPVIDREQLVLQYREALTLMRELKAIGAHNAAAERPAGLTGKARLQAVLQAYEAFRQGASLPATYEVVYGVAVGPPEGQPVRSGAGETATFSIDAIKRSSR